MKHSYNDDSGIKMDSNEHDAMEWNEVLIEVNNLIYYTHETEQYAWSYGMMNRAPQYLQNILTDHAQKRHGSLGSNMNTWHKNIIRAMT